MLRIALGVLLCVHSPLDQEDARALVEQLRSDSVVERDAAAKKLLALGEAAREALEKAAKDPDAEVSGRAGRVLRILEIRSRIPAGLKAAVPGIEDRLATDVDRAWTAAFFAAMGEGNSHRLPSSIGREDFDFLVARALRGASGENEAARLCQIAGDHNLRSAIPQLIRLLSDSSFKVQAVARRALVDLDAREAAGSLLEVVEKGPEGASSLALRVLADLELKEVVPGLVALLRSGEARVRANAAAALEDTGSLEIAPALLPLLGDPDAAVCRAAARTLGALGARDAVPGLLVLLRDRGRDAQGAAAFALAKLEAGDAVPDLMKALESPGKFDARDEVARALGSLGAKEALPPLLRLLEDKDFQGQAEVLPVVARLGGGAASPQIVACFKHEDSEVRAAAVEAARALKIKGLAPALAGLLEDSSDAVWQEAMDAIVETGAGEIAPQLRTLAVNENAKESCRRAALLVLGRGGVREAVPFLRERVRDGKLQTGLRFCAAHALADLGAREAVEDLLTLLDAKDAELQEAGLVALGRLGAKEAAPRLRKLLGDPDGNDTTWSGSARALAAMGDAEAVPLLRERLEEGDVPGAAALALAELGDRESVPELLKVLESDDVDERRNAADALARLDPAAGLARLKELLKDGRRETRIAAADSLCRLGSREGVPILLQAARDDVRQPLTALNAVRSPARWAELRARKVAWLLPGGSVSSTRLLRVVAGVTVAEEEDGTSSWIFGSDFEQGWRPALHALEEYEDSFILEADRIRTLPRHKEIRFWQDWWRGEEKRK